MADPSHDISHDRLNATQSESRNARYGIVLFAAYVILYGLFVYLSAFKPQVMASRPFGGVNLAVLYGLGLIVAAIVLALVYMMICRAGSGEAPR